MKTQDLRYYDKYSQNVDSEQSRVIIAKDRYHALEDEIMPADEIAMSLTDLVDDMKARQDLYIAINGLNVAYKTARRGEKLNSKRYQDLLDAFMQKRLYLCSTEGDYDSVEFGGT